MGARPETCAQVQMGPGPSLRVPPALSKPRRRPATRAKAFGRKGAEPTEGRAGWPDGLLWRCTASRVCLAGGIYSTAETYALRL